MVHFVNQGRAGSLTALSVAGAARAEHIVGAMHRDRHPLGTTTSAFRQLRLRDALAALLVLVVSCGALLQPAFASTPSSSHALRVFTRAVPASKPTKPCQKTLPGTASLCPTVSLSFGVMAHAMMIADAPEATNAVRLRFDDWSPALQCRSSPPYRPPRSAA
jgi:hypothetical protein